MMSALFMAMMLTGAGGLADAQGRAKPPLLVPMAPPVPVMVPPPPAPMLPPSPPPPRQPVAQQPVLLRAPLSCFPEATRDGPYDFSACFNGGDYPYEAWRAGEQGVAGVRVTVGPDGRPTACEITTSSGSARLNRATCDVLRQRIIGARDVVWAPVTGTIEGSVDWVRPDGPPRDDRPDLLTYFSMDDYPAAALRANEQGVTGVQLEVSPGGRVVNCTVISSSGSAALDAATCRIIRYRTRYLPARDSNGMPVTGIDFARVNWRLPEE